MVFTAGLNGRWRYRPPQTAEIEGAQLHSVEEEEEENVDGGHDDDGDAR